MSESNSLPPLIVEFPHAMSSEAFDRVQATFRRAAQEGLPVAIDPSMTVYQRVGGRYVKLGEPGPDPEIAEKARLYHELHLLNWPPCLKPAAPAKPDLYVIAGSSMQFATYVRARDVNPRDAVHLNREAKAHGLPVGTEVVLTGTFWMLKELPEVMESLAACQATYRHDPI